MKRNKFRADESETTCAVAQVQATPWRASTCRTASTSLSSGTANCASACFFRYSSRSLIAVSVAPRIKSLIWTSFFDFLVAALDDRAGAVALVGVFELLADAVLRIAEIKLGADAGFAQRRHHVLVVGDAVAVEHRDHHRAGRRLVVELAEQASAPPAAATRRWRSRSPAPARRESATPGRRSARRRRPSRSGPGGPSRPWFRAAVQPRRPGRCSTRGRGRRTDRCEFGHRHNLPPATKSLIASSSRERPLRQVASFEQRSAIRQSHFACAIAKVASRPDAVFACNRKSS